MSRRIAQRDDGVVVDVLVWESVADEEDGAARLMVELADSHVHAAIDQRTVDWTALPIHRLVERWSMV